jgi:hypothetical protein
MALNNISIFYYVTQLGALKAPFCPESFILSFVVEKSKH